MKRYVMLEDKEIVDTTKEEWLDIYESGWYEKLDEEYLEWHGYDSSIAKILIAKQSDNLLDLLEVGDCVEFKNGGIVYIPNRHQLTKAKNISHLITAIWKQNHDTMRRYEV